MHILYFATKCPSDEPSINYKYFRFLPHLENFFNLTPDKYRHSQIDACTPDEPITLKLGTLKKKQSKIPIFSIDKKNGKSFEI